MIIKVYMEIETEDYGGREFKTEIEKLIADIDSTARLLRFEMRQRECDVMFADVHAIRWTAPGYEGEVR